MSKSMEELFEKLHRMQAEKLLEILEGAPTSAELSAINRFLSDNNVTGIKKDNAGLKKLSEGLSSYEDAMSQTNPTH